MSEDRERVIADPTPCTVRHVRRTRAGETVKATVLGATFVVDQEGLNGRQSWQQAQVTVALSDDGTFTITFPNAAGDDGVLHRERFGLLTDPTYRVGEEWLEFYRGPVGPDNLVGVGSPKTYNLGRSTLTLSGPDVTFLFTLARASDLDVWHHAPRDVFEWYTRLPVLPLAYDFRAYDATAATAAGWTVTSGTADATGRGVLLAAGGSARHDLSGIEPIAWTADARCAQRAGATTGATSTLTVRRADSTTIILEHQPSAADNGRVRLLGTAFASPGLWRGLGRTKRTMPGGASLRLLCRREWIYGFVEGELVVRARVGVTGAGQAPDRVTIASSNGDYLVQQIAVMSLAPFAMRGTDKGDRRLPGIPPPGGLRGKYRNEAAAAAAVSPTTSGYPDATCDPLDPISDERIDPVLNFAVASPPAWAAAPAIPARGTLSVRWTGAIYLDLSASRIVRVSAARDAVRVWIGGTVRGIDAPAIDSWTLGAKANLDSADLRATLGSTSGWFPIVVELAVGASGGGIVLQDNTSGSYALVPTERLSPLGCFEETIRQDSHRDILGKLSEGFGYQWRAEPRMLESGEFPAQIIPRVRVGIDTDRIVQGSRAVGLVAEGEAGDAIDMLLLDAAGLADPKGAEQLSVEALNFLTAGSHLFLSTGYESLADISELSQAEVRVSSLLFLRSGPNETVRATPTDAQRGEVVDLFPLTGALARLKWQPGDGIRLALDDLSVIDRSPRQLLQVGLTMYPDGSAPPDAGFRQRARGARAFLERVARATFAAQRRPQGQVSLMYGAAGSPSGAALGAADSYSRMALPANLDNVVEVWLDVTYKTDASPWNLEVNGVDTGVDVTDVGQYPVRVSNAFATSTGRVMNSRLTSTGAGSTGQMLYQLIARVKL